MYKTGLAQLVADAPSMTTACPEAAMRAELEYIATAAGYAKVKVSGEGRVKAHTLEGDQAVQSKEEA